VAKKVMVRVFLPPDVAERIRELAEEEGLNPSQYIRRLVLAHLRREAEK